MTKNPRNNINIDKKDKCMDYKGIEDEVNPFLPRGSCISDVVFELFHAISTEGIMMESVTELGT